MTHSAVFAAELDRLGAWYPTGDGDALRASGAAWSAAADTLAEIAMVLDVAATMVTDSHAGEAAERFATLWRRWSGDRGYLERTIAACRQVAAVVDDVGTDVDVADRAVFRLAEQVLDEFDGAPLDRLDDSWRQWLVDGTDAVRTAFASEVTDAIAALPVGQTDRAAHADCPTVGHDGRTPAHLHAVAVDFGFGPGDVVLPSRTGTADGCSGPTLGADPTAPAPCPVPPTVPPVTPIACPPTGPGTAPWWYGAGGWPPTAPYTPYSPYVPAPYVPAPAAPLPPPNPPLGPIDAWEPTPDEPVEWDPPPPIERYEPEPWEPIERFEPEPWESWEPTPSVPVESAAPSNFAPTSGIPSADPIPDPAADLARRAGEVTVSPPRGEPPTGAPTLPTSITVDPPGRPSTGGVATGAAVGAAAAAAGAGRGRMPFFPFMPMGGMSGGGDESAEPKRRVKRTRDLF